MCYELVRMLEILCGRSLTGMLLQITGHIVRCLPSIFMRYKEYFA